MSPVRGEFVPDDCLGLFEKATFAHVATLPPGGFPHVTPVRVDYSPHAGRLLVNTERGRRKGKNVRSDPRVGVSMTDPDDLSRMLSVTGEVDGIIAEGARERVDQLAGRYVGENERPDPLRTDRVILEIRPDRVSHRGRLPVVTGG